LNPDSALLFLGEGHKEALAVLKQGVVSDKAFLLFTGGVGTGKTTLINDLAKNLEDPGYVCVISHSTLELDDFFTISRRSWDCSLTATRQSLWFSFQSCSRSVNAPSAGGC
jgi:general secretion pathway protein A